MAVDSRTIDLAKTASIDMMALNNKVVNMRQIVKRTKVQVINKLCKNIAALKKKKGTDEQKTQNLRKVERLIEEIDSIKRLKEDKVTKYSLANTISFTDVCKTSLSAGPRAMARLADHSLMQKEVGDFRTQHPDWRDLAAYLLVKQTGRRFKTKKQKERKKMSRTVENIHASETMTKAYIQERFGEDGLKKAEQRFERKRKRAPQNINVQPSDTDEVGKEPMNKKKKDELNIEVESGVGEEIKAESECRDIGDEETAQVAPGSSNEDDKSEEKLKVTGRNKNISESLPSTDESEEERHALPHDNNNTRLSAIKCVEEKEVKETPLNQDSKNKSRKALDEEPKAQTNDSDSETSTSGDENVEDVQESLREAKYVTSPKKKNECVVKELDIERSDNDSSDEEMSAEVSSDEEDVQNSSVSSSDKDDSVPNISNRQKKKAKVKDKNVPSILTSKPQKAISDPFFAGSDDEGDEEDAFNDFDNALLHEPGDDMGVESSSSKSRSMFYNPHGEEIYRKGVRVPAQTWSNQRGGGRWQRQERGRGGSFLGQQRGRGGSFSGQHRGRGMSLGGSNTKGFRGSSRGEQPLGTQSFGRPRFDNPQKTRSEQSTDTFKKPPASAEKLHPSWEASKKRKAEQSGIQAFKGNKITFDDDD